MVLFLKWFGVLFSVNTDSYGLLLHNGKVLEGPLSDAPSNTRKPGKVRETLLRMCGLGKNKDVKIPPTFSTVSVGCYIIPCVRGLVQRLIETALSKQMPLEPSPYLDKMLLLEEEEGEDARGDLSSEKRCEILLSTLEKCS